MFDCGADGSTMGMMGRGRHDDLRDLADIGAGCHGSPGHLEQSTCYRNLGSGRPQPGPGSTGRTVRTGRTDH